MPSLAAVEATANAKFEKNFGDDDAVITVFGLDDDASAATCPRGVPDRSPYVAKVEAVLRMLKIPYQKRKSQNMSENPRGKVPFANIYGTMVDDSARIVEYVIATATGGIRHPDSDLTGEQLALGHFIRQTLQGSLYWVGCYYAFDTDAGRQIFARQLAEDGVPSPIRQLVTAMIVRKMHRDVEGTGLTKFPKSEIAKQGRETLRALSRILGDREFVLGTPGPTTYDADCYGHLAHCVLVLCDDSSDGDVDIDAVFGWAREVLWEKEEGLDNLVAYVERMRDLLYPESERVGRKVKSE